MRWLVLCIAVGLAVASYRHDASRSLIKLPGVTASDFLALQGVLGLQGDEVETWEVDHLLVWATADYKDKLTRSGYKHMPAVDQGAVSFAEERKANYTDKVGEEPDWTQYCGYTCMTQRLSELAESGNCAFPVELTDIGKSIDGRSIWVFKIGNTGPEVLMAGNIHGDETTGGQLLQRWVWETCNKASPEQKQIAETVQGYYMPMMNPDGYERNRRGNAANADLNRSFPPVTGGTGSPQPETTHYMNFINGKEFDVSIMYHGGAVCANYAYDNCYTSAVVPRPCPPASTQYHSRHSAVVPSATAYTQPWIQAGVRCTVGSQCLTNGASWYQISGSSQDWAFHFADDVDLTLEVSATKRPAGSTMPQFYEINAPAIFGFMNWPTKKHVA